MRPIYKTELVKTVVLAGSLLSAVYFVAAYAPARLSTEFDDAYMYCRYASNFLAGNGFSWNAADGPAFGATSPAFLFLVTVSKSLFTADDSFLLSFTSFYASILGLGVLLLVGYKFGKLLSKKHLPLLVIPLCLVSTSFRYHSFTGMETTLAFLTNAILILAVVVYSRKPGDTRFVFMLLASVLTFTVRPDNGIYSMLFPIVYLLSVRKLPPKRAAVFLIAFIAAAVLLLLLYSRLFGSPLPVPFYAKSGDYFSGYAGRANWNASGYLLLFLKDVAPFAGIVILFGRKSTVPALLAILLPVAFTFVYYATTLQIMGWFARYYFPSIPFVVFAAFTAVEDKLKNRYPVSLLKRVPALVVFLAPICLSPLKTVIINWWENSVPKVQLYSTETVYATSAHTTLEAIPWWNSIQYVSAVAGGLPPGIKIAATEYGYIASENLHAVIIDMAGLHDMELARSGFSSTRILSRLPDFIWMPHTDYTRFRAFLLDDPVFYENYAFYPEVFNYGVAMRLNSSYFCEMQTTLDSVFSLAYPGRELSEFLASVQPVGQ
jgi:hypothetical protein